MKILVTGAKGFVGKNLCAQLNNIKTGKAKFYGLVSAEEAKANATANAAKAIEEVFEYDLGNTLDELDYFCKEAVSLSEGDEYDRADKTRTSGSF